MKLTRKTVSGVLYATLLLASASVPALTLGKLRGAALLGQELDVSASVQFAADEDISATCFAAEVVYGNTPVEASRLVVSTQPGTQPNTKIVRITSGARVDDAVVTVSLKTICGPKAVRRYVLLSEMASELTSDGVTGAATGSVSAIEVVANRKEPGSIGAATVAPVKGGVPQAAAKPVGKQRSKNTAPKLQVGTAPLLKATEAPVKPAPSGSMPNTEALDDLHRRVESIEKWQAQTSAADDLLKSQERAKAMEADINGLKAITAKNQQNLQTVASALESSDSESYGRTLVYALGALLVVCVGAVAYVFSRVRSAGGDVAPWWFGGEPRATSSASSHAVLATNDGNAPIAAESGQAPLVPLDTVADAGAPITNVDIDVGSAPVPVASTQAASLSKLPGSAPEFSNSGLGQIRTINTKEMLDIRQQAEFFMALGQHDDAVTLLENSIQSSADANPLVFLDLLAIYHTLGRREEFERYREEFNAQFTGRVLPYADFSVEGNGLDAYEDICQQIVVLWPTEYTIDFIEQCLVRTPEDDPQQGIDLDAFKDLLLLYGVLKRLDLEADSGLIPFSATRTPNTQMNILPEETAIEPQSVHFDDAASPLPTLSSADADADAVAAAGNSFSLDLDLNLDGPADAAPSVPNNLIDFDMSGFVKPAIGKDIK